MKIGQEVLIHGDVDEIRKDVIIIRNKGGYFGTVECEITDIEMSNADKVLDEIRAEIPKLTCGDNEYRQALVKVADVIKCIDKHRKGESEC